MHKWHTGLALAAVAVVGCSGVVDERAEHASDGGSGSDHTTTGGHATTGGHTTTGGQDGDTTTGAQGGANTTALVERPSSEPSRHSVTITVRNESNATIWIAEAGAQCTSIGVESEQDGTWTPEPIEEGIFSKEACVGSDCMSPTATAWIAVPPGDTEELHWNGRAVVSSSIEIECPGGYVDSTVYTALQPLDATRVRLSVPFWRASDVCEVGESTQPCGSGGGMSSCRPSLLVCDSPHTATAEVDWPESGAVNTDVVVVD